jgi:hypothetical protein
MNRMPTYQWLSIGDTRLLMHLHTSGALAEWHPIAQVTRRQIYAAVAPMYYAWWRTVVGDMPIGKYETLEEAVAQTEKSVGVVRTGD